MNDSVTFEVSIIEKISGKVVATKSARMNAKRDNITEVKLDIPVQEFTNWSPEQAFPLSC